MDPVARIEAASRSLRQELARNRERPRSKGSLHERSSLPGSGFHAGSREDTLTAHRTGEGARPRGVNSQQRIRSAENQSRYVRRFDRPTAVETPLQGVQSEPLATASPPAEVMTDCVVQDADGPPVATAFPDNTPDEEAHVVQPQNGALLASSQGSSSQAAGYPHSNVEDVGGLHLGDLKRPFSRKKAPSVSAQTGLGALNTPEKMMDAFEQKKMRHPIPIASESWCQRPPSRHGLPSKPIERPSSRAATLDHARPASRAGTSDTGRPASRAGPTDNGRPPSRAGTTSKGGSTGHLDASLAIEDPKLHNSSPWSQVTLREVIGRSAPRHSASGSTALQIEPPVADQTAQSATWAAACKDPPALRGDPLARGRDRKVNKEFRAQSDPSRVTGAAHAATAASPKEFIFSSYDQPHTAASASSGARSPSSLQQAAAAAATPSGRPSPQHLTKNFSDVFDVFDHSSEWAAPGSHAAWASPAAAAAAADGALEVSGHGLGTPWANGPNMGMAVEDIVDSELDVGHHRRDSTPVQMIVTRSGVKKSRADPHLRSRERGARPGPQSKISTNLDGDFLALFAA